MTDDIVARLRHEHELCVVMGDTKAGALVGEAADRLEALEIKERESFQKFVDANEARIDAEARVRELEDRISVLERDLDAQIAGHRLSANEATKHLMRVRELEAELAEAYERAAKVADGWLAQFAHHEIKYISARMYASDAIQDIATAIRNLAQEVKHEAE